MLAGVAEVFAATVVEVVAVAVEIAGLVVGSWLPCQASVSTRSGTLQVGLGWAQRRQREKHSKRERLGLSLMYWTRTDEPCPYA